MVFPGLAGVTFSSAGHPSAALWLRGPGFPWRLFVCAHWQFWAGGSEVSAHPLGCQVGSKEFTATSPQVSSSLASLTGFLLSTL